MRRMNKNIWWFVDRHVYTKVDQRRTGSKMAGTKSRTDPYGDCGLWVVVDWTQ